MRKYFITGLVLLLPLAMTIAITVFIVNLFTGPFIGFVQHFLNSYKLFQEGFLFLSKEQIQLYFSQFFILFLLFFFTVLLGIVTRWFVVHYFIRFGEYIFEKIPIVRSIYKTSKDVIKTIFTTSTRSFKQVVLVPFPNKETLGIGLITKENVENKEPHEKDEHLIAVFVPTTPNPTSGFLMLFKRKDLVYLDMKIEDAFKYIISCGVVDAPFKALVEEKIDETP
jgi:uncharacterized membrane protein